MEWISIKDQLPKKSKDVLTYSVIPNEKAYKTYSPIYVGFYEDGEFYSTYAHYENENYISLHYVTHWMPLPELPNSEIKHGK